MSRSYKGIRLKKNRVYSGKDLQRAFNITKNTVSNWVKGGLQPSDDKRPYLFRGGVVSEFLKARRERAKTEVRPGEFKCARCKMAVFPDLETLSHRNAANGTPMSFARCSECGADVRKFVSQADLDVFAALRDPNTPVDSSREGMRAGPGGIGICEAEHEPGFWGANDRILYNWQSYAGRLAEQTTDQHLAAIRYMEDVLEGKAFDRLTIQDVSEVRSALKASLTVPDDTRKAASTVSHTASYITAFLDWLIKQDGYKRLPADLPGYMRMPKAVYAAAMPRKDKLYLSIEEAEELLMGMPSATVSDQRARAMFAIGYLGALRADTITSLRVCHFDTENRQIIQDAATSRTKNGKSLRIRWFPIPESFVEAVKDWIVVVKTAGLRGEDALFPSLPTLQTREDLRDPCRDPIEPMTSKDAVTKAFALACRDTEMKCNPHSVKDTIAKERDRLPLTQPQRKAWSENMGHESEKITETHYGKLTERERIALFEEIEEIGDTKIGSKRWPAFLTDADKIAFMDVVMAMLGASDPTPIDVRNEVKRQPERASKTTPSRQGDLFEEWLT